MLTYENRSSKFLSSGDHSPLNLSDLKEERQKQSKRKSAFESEQQSKKQKSIQDCVRSTTPYGPRDPRQETISNSVASMICIDGIPTNVVAWPGLVVMDVTSSY